MIAVFTSCLLQPILNKIAYRVGATTRVRKVATMGPRIATAADKASFPKAHDMRLIMLCEKFHNYRIYTLWAFFMWVVSTIRHC